MGVQLNYNSAIMLSSGRQMSNYCAVLGPSVRYLGTDVQSLTLSSARSTHAAQSALPPVPDYWNQPLSCPCSRVLAETKPWYCARLIGERWLEKTNLHVCWLGSLASLHTATRSGILGSSLGRRGTDCGQTCHSRCLYRALETGTLNAKCQHSRSFAACSSNMCP